MSQLVLLYTAHAVWRPEMPRVRALLAPDRLAAAERLRQPQARACAVTADLLLTAAARRFAPNVPLPLARAAAPGGKPFVPDLPGFHFSLSHSGDQVVCAVAGQPVGVDVECPRPYPPGLIDRCCADGERVLLGAPDAFFDLWMCKEAVMKCCGLGLALPPREIVLGSLHPPRLAEPVRGVSYGLTLAVLPGGSRSAVCVKGTAAPPVRILTDVLDALLYADG